MLGPGINLVVEPSPNKNFDKTFWRMGRGEQKQKQSRYRGWLSAANTVMWLKTTSITLRFSQVPINKQQLGDCRTSVAGWGIEQANVERQSSSLD